MVIIENIMKDSIEVKYEDESTTHNPQVSVDLLKMTIQYVDFLGVENFDLILSTRQNQGLAWSSGSNLWEN